MGRIRGKSLNSSGTRLMNRHDAAIRRNSSHLHRRHNRRDRHTATKMANNCHRDTQTWQFLYNYQQL